MLRNSAGRHDQRRELHPASNVGRNILTGPGLMDFEFSVVKNTRIPRISEAFNVQLRLDIQPFNRAISTADKRIHPDPRR